jgi:hypothetical protein
MAIQYTNPTIETPPIKIATDVFDAPLLKPDAQLAALEKKIRKAKTQEERDAIQGQIDARTMEIMSETGFTNIGFGSGGSFIPGGGQGIGSQILEPTGVPGVYSKSTITSDTSIDPYGRQSLEKTNDPAAIGRPNYDPNATNQKLFYDENGNQLTPEQVVKSGVGASFAAAGWDIGFGAGNIGPGTPATTNLPFSGSASTVNLPFSGSASTVNLKTAAQIAADEARAKAQGERQSAYDLLLQQFNLYGLGSLVTPLKDLIISGASPSEFTIRLRETDAYKKRFAANAARIAKGLTAISEAEYIGLEDQYQNIMRNYGLPASYYTRGDMGRQEGFEKFIGNDVSAAELEDRVMTAQNRVMNANPEVIASLRQFYPDISNGDILAYTLDPDKGLSEIKRKVTAAEIGGGAMQAGLGITGARAEELGAAGITKQQAQQGFQTVAEVAPRGGQLAAIYGESPYTQQTAEQEVFGLAGSTEAAKQRKKLVGLERAAFSGQTGAAQGALGRERAGNL